MDSDRDFKARIQKAAKNYRFIKRADVFERNRNSVKTELSYLKILQPEERQLILHSIHDPIPAQLPPLSPYTISYYRRSSKPVFRTRAYEGNQDIHPHMAYQSLFILAGIQQIHFPNYQQIVKEFQTDLERYISCEFPEIREMAMIAAGNKILGKEKDIQKIIQIDPKQMWVMINHIYERKISSTHLFAYLQPHNEIAFRSLFQMSNSNDDDIIDAIMTQQTVLETLIENLNNYNIQIRKYVLRIIGNILAEKQDYVYTLAKYKILDKLYDFLNESDSQLRKDACWAISNFSVQKVPSTTIVQNHKMIEKLVSMFQYQKEIKIMVQLCHIFACLVSFAEKNDVYRMIWDGHLLERCGYFLEIQDQDLIHVTLYLISKILDLGDYFAEDDGNCFAHEIKNLGIKSKITEKTYYTENAQISKLSSQLQEKLQEDYC